MKFNTKIISFIMTLVVVICSTTSTVTSYAAATTPKSVYTSIEKAYGNKFPLKNDASNLSPNAVGVSKKLCESYAGKVKSTKNEKYVLFIAKASNSNDVKKIKSSLSNYIKVESHSMANYLSADGKKLYNNAKIGTKGLYVYLIMLDTTGNQKAVKAFKTAAK